MTDSFGELGKALGEGGDAMDKFKSIALNAISQVAESLLKDLGGSLFGGKSGGGFGDFVGSAVSGIGSFFSGFLPSFDVGSYNVPSDMTANIHKGEMIIPAKKAAQIRGGGMNTGGTSVVQNITIGEGVSAQVRQEVAKMLPDLKRATVQGVEDARYRGIIA